MEVKTHTGKISKTAQNSQNFLLSREEEILNEEENFNNHYKRNRKKAIKMLKAYANKYCSKSDYKNQMLYLSIKYLDTILSQNKINILNGLIFKYVCLSCFLISLKFVGEEDSAEIIIKHFKKIYSNIYKIIELKCLKLLNYNLMDYTAYDYLKIISKISIKSNEILNTLLTVLDNLIEEFTSTQYPPLILAISIFAYFKNSQYITVPFRYSKYFSDYRVKELVELIKKQDVTLNETETKKIQSYKCINSNSNSKNIEKEEKPKYNKINLITKSYKIVHKNMIPKGRQMDNSIKFIANNKADINDTTTRNINYNNRNADNIKRNGRNKNYFNNNNNIDYNISNIDNIKKNERNDYYINTNVDYNNSNADYNNSNIDNKGDQRKKNCSVKSVKITKTKDFINNNLNNYIICNSNYYYNDKCINDNNNSMESVNSNNVQYQEKDISNNIYKTTSMTKKKILVTYQYIKEESKEQDNHNFRNENIHSSSIDKTTIITKKNPMKNLINQKINSKKSMKEKINIKNKINIKDKIYNSQRTFDNDLSQIKTNTVNNSINNSIHNSIHNYKILIIPPKLKRQKKVINIEKYPETYKVYNRSSNNSRQKTSNNTKTIEINQNNKKINNNFNFYNNVNINNNINNNTYDSNYDNEITTSSISIKRKNSIKIVENVSNKNLKKLRAIYSYKCNNLNESKPKEKISASNTQSESNNQSINNNISYYNSMNKKSEINKIVKITRFNRNENINQKSYNESNNTSLNKKIFSKKINKIFRYNNNLEGKD